MAAIGTLECVRAARRTLLQNVHTARLEEIRRPFDLIRGIRFIRFQGAIDQVPFDQVPVLVLLHLDGNQILRFWKLTLNKDLVGELLTSARVADATSIIPCVVHDDVLENDAPLAIGHLLAHLSLDRQIVLGPRDVGLGHALRRTLHLDHVAHRTIDLRRVVHFLGEVRGNLLLLLVDRHIELVLDAGDRVAHFTLVAARIVRHQVVQHDAPTSEMCARSIQGLAVLKPHDSGRRIATGQAGYLEATVAHTAIDNVHQVTGSRELRRFEHCRSDIVLAFGLEIIIRVVVFVLLLLALDLGQRRDVFVLHRVGF